jgi:hypothetical protein
MTNIIVYAPHVCIPIKGHSVIDPGCDYRSREYAKVIAKKVKGNLILSRTLRAECDNNRVKCRQTPSRKRLRKNITTDSFIIDVHTFDRELSRWRSGPEPDVVILSTGNERYYEKVAGAIRKLGFDAIVLKGHLTYNDVQKEIRELGAKGVLVELAQDLTKADARKIGGVFT